MSADEVTGRPPPFPVPEPGGAKLTHRLPSGRWLDVLCNVLDGRDERVVDFRDVTAAKELEEAKDLFLATTSHELRTPITVVQGFASTLASRWDKLADAERRSAVQTIADRAGSLGRLVEQLLLGSRAGADQLTVTNGPFDLAALLRGTAVAFRPLSEAHTLAADIPDGLPAAYGDPMATDIIVGQLLENAFKYSPDGGAVTVAARLGGRLDRGQRARTRGSASPPATTSGSSSGSSRARPATGAGSAASASACTSCASWPGPRAARWPPAPGPAAAPACGCSCVAHVPKCGAGAPDD